MNQKGWSPNLATSIFERHHLHFEGFVGGMALRALKVEVLGEGCEVRRGA